MWARWGIAASFRQLVTDASGAAPTITGFPAGDSFSPGSNINVIGTHLVDPTTFTLTGGFVSGTFDMLDPGARFDDTEWDDVIPPELSSGNYSAVATNANGVSAGHTTHSAGSGGTATAPTVDPAPGCCVPNTGSTAGGDDALIFGADFTRDMELKWGGVSIPFTFTDQNKVQIVTPAHAAGAVSVQVTNNDGTDTTVGAFTYS